MWLPGRIDQGQPATGPRQTGQCRQQQTHFALAAAVDVVLVYEDGGLPPLDTLETWQSCRPSVGVIPYAVPSLDQLPVAACR